MKKLFSIFSILLFGALLPCDSQAQNRTVEQVIQERKDQIAEMEQDILYYFQLAKTQDRIELYVPLAFKINRYPHGFSELFETREIKIKKIDFVSQFIIFLYENGLDPEFDLMAIENQVQKLSAIGEANDLEVLRKRTDEHNSRIEKPIKLKMAYDRLLNETKEKYVIDQKELYRNYLKRYGEIAQFSSDTIENIIQRFIIHFEK